jgi:hypothetical protein
MKLNKKNKTRRVTNNDNKNNKNNKNNKTKHGKLSKNTKKITQKKNHRGGCDWGWFNSDDVWERLNGIKSGRIYNVMQFYKMIDRTTCTQMESLGNKLKSKASNSTISSLSTITEGALTKHFSYYTLYDNTREIINTKGTRIDSYSFIIGLVKIEKDQIIFYQAEKDKKEEEALQFSITLNNSVNVIIDIEKKDIFFFKSEDAKWKILRAGLMLPSNFIKKMKSDARTARTKTEEQQMELTQQQKREQKVQAGENIGKK